MSEPKLEPRPLRILVIDDEEHIRFAIAMCLEADGHQVSSAGTIEAAFQETVRQAFDLIFLDVRLGTSNGLDYLPRLLSENPWARVVVITAYASIETAIQAMKLGATDYLPKPFEQSELQLVTNKVAQRRQLERNIAALQKTLGTMDPEVDFPTASPLLSESLEIARRIADSNVAVLIRGEVGTGKGRLARAIHAWSRRSQNPFTSVSMQGLTDVEAEVELFGAGADESGPVGAVAFCHGGTLLVEEVSQVPLRLQTRVLSLLRDQQFESQNEVLSRPSDVRIIATTTFDLQPVADRGLFRADLLMALRVIQIDLPALRDRREDIPMLAERYVAHFGREHHRPVTGFTRDAEYVLQSHSWPGNTRELRNVVERAVLECTTETIGLECLPPNLISGANRASPTGETLKGGYAIGDLVALNVIEEAHVRKVIDSVRTLRQAASILGINASTLYRKLRMQPPVRDDDHDDKPEA